MRCVLAMVLFSGCAVTTATPVSLTGQLETRAFPVSEDVVAVRVSGGAQAEVLVGQAALDVTTDAGYFPRVRATTDGRLLSLGTVYAEDNIDADVVFELTVPELAEASASGGSQVLVDQLQGAAMTLDASGGSDVVISQVNGGQLTIDGSGGATMHLSNVQVQRLVIDGSGGFAVTLEDTAAEALIVDLSGGATVTFDGACDVTVESVQGDIDLGPCR